MAESNDVETALVALALVALAADPVLAGTAAYRGWPVAERLDQALAAGLVQVSVAAAGEGRNTTRHISPPRVLGPRLVTLTVAVSPGVARFGGVGGAGQVAGVIVNGVATAVRLGAADTPASVATALAARLPGAQAAGELLSVPGLSDARVGVDRVLLQEVRRQERRFRIAFWCPTPELRDRAVALVDPVVAATPFLALADGSCGRLRGAGEEASDRAEGAPLWRRDLLMDVEYATTQAVALPEMLWGTLVADLGGGVLLQAGDQVMPDQALTDGQGEVLADAAGHVVGALT